MNVVRVEARRSSVKAEKVKLTVYGADLVAVAVSFAFICQVSRDSIQCSVRKALQ